MKDKVQKDEICFDCYSDDIVINPNETNKTEYWCCNCRDITSTMLKSELGSVYKNESDTTESELEDER